MKKLIAVLLVLAVGAGLFFGGLFTGANKVRGGLIKNYPLFKSIVSSATVEVDSVFECEVVKTNQPAFHELLSKYTKGDSIKVRVTYHAVYGTNLSTRHFILTLKEKEEVDIMLPKPYPYNIELKLQSLQVNGVIPGICINSEEYGKVQRFLLEEMSVPLSKAELHLEKARRNTAEVVMWYLMPYKYKVNLYFDGRNYVLPEVPGINKDVDEYMKEVILKK